MMKHGYESTSRHCGDNRPTTDASTLTDEELRQWANHNYESLTKEYRRGLYRALQNRRHLSKQQARAYVKRHLKPGGLTTKSTEVGNSMRNRGIGTED